jgi:two-component system, NarL family, response regulator DevR
MDESAPGQRRVGVFLLDDHEIVRRGVKDLLESAPDIVVGEAGTAASALARILPLKPEMVSACAAISGRRCRRWPA